MKQKKKTEYRLKRGSACGRARRACTLTLAALAALLLASSCAGGDREAAQRAFDRGAAAYEALDMDAAKQAFAECCRLDGSLYEDAKQYLDGIAQYESLYLQGVAAFEKGDYNSAYSAFLGIKDYLNSADYLARIDSLKADYESAVALYEAGEYIRSRAAFMQLGGYQRSEAYVANVDAMIGLYNEGISLMNRSSFQNAIRAFRAINTAFLDSEELIELCRGSEGGETVKLGEYIAGYTAEYGGSVNFVSINPGILFDMRDSRGVVICGAMDESGVVRYISFCIPKTVSDRLGVIETRSALAHCIRALNPELAEHESILADIEGCFTAQGVKYGCMRVHLGDGMDGTTVLTAEYEP